VSADDDELPRPGRPAPVFEPEPPPAEIAELAEACRQYVLGATKVLLDYTPETLPLVDHYIGEAREATRERPELVELLTRSAGAYFGEVVRRLGPSFWLLPSVDSHDWLLCFENVFLAVNPVAVIWDVLEESSEHGGPSSEPRLERDQREAVEQRLAQLPPVSEDEYWMLATRHEVLEMIVDQLRLEMQRAGTEDVRFDAADYEDVPTPLGQA
jgi:hypothetical protein